MLSSRGVLDIEHARIAAHLPSQALSGHSRSPFFGVLSDCTGIKVPALA
jgi:hypothetical protein